MTNPTAAAVNARPCPRCHAQPGQPCVGPRVHAARLLAAVKRGTR